MLEERTTKIHIFEGVDVTGKTSQAKELVKYLGDKGEYFKFPRKTVKVDEVNTFLFEISFINKAFEHIHDINPEVINIVKGNDDKVYITDIYKLFDMIHKNIYNNTSEKIYEDFVISDNSIIKDIIIVDIIANAKDKHNFITTDLFKCMINDKIAIIDRFFVSGDVYNCSVPLEYLSNLVTPMLINSSSELRDKFYNTIKQLFKISFVATNSLKLIMNEIVKVNPREDISISPILPSFNQLFNILYYFDSQSMKISLNSDKITQYYFEPSAILYENFKKKNEENKQDREVSQYDTNEFVRTFAIKDYKDSFKHLSKTSDVHTIDTDVIIDCIKLDSKTEEISNPIEKFFSYFKLYVKD